MEASPSESARCVNCRSEVSVPPSYAHGDHIKCATCGTQHKVQRGNVTRLVLADAGPIRESLRETQHRIATLEGALRSARHSVGLGVNGLGLGLIYILYQVGRNDVSWSQDLLWTAGGIALGSGLVLEVCNYLFLAKRKAITQLSGEIAQLRSDARTLQQKIRDATRA
jgi:hypothetical protein